VDRLAGNGQLRIAGPVRDRFALALLLFAAAPLAVAAEAPDPPGEIRVTVTVKGPDKKAGPGAGAVVWVMETEAERRAADALKPHTTKPRIASHLKRFEPRISAVPVGTTVEFPNLDKIFHNVFSLSEKAKFDLGLYRNGSSRSMTFDSAGVVKIYCNIHPQMAAFLIVVDGRVYAQTGPDGSAVLPRVPPGKHTVRAWDERGGTFETVVDVPPGKTVPLAIDLDGSSWRDAPHKNKYGKDYPPPSDDENRY
jgi:plastocyanin